MTKPILSQQYLKECLHYDPETGIFTWLHRPREHFVRSNEFHIWNGRFAGKEPGNQCHYGYRVMTIDWKRYRAHRLAFLYMTGRMPDKDVDHIDRNKLNNSWGNLREVTNQDNHRNMKLSKANTSGATGIYQVRDKWEARIMVDYKSIILGYFPTKDEAVFARKQAETKYGFHPNHGIEL